MLSLALNQSFFGQTCFSIPISHLHRKESSIDFSLIGLPLQMAPWEIWWVEKLPLIVLVKMTRSSANTQLIRPNLHLFLMFFPGTHTDKCLKDWLWYRWGIEIYEQLTIATQRRHVPLWFDVDWVKGRGSVTRLQVCMIIIVELFSALPPSSLGQQTKNAICRF